MADGSLNSLLLSFAGALVAALLLTPVARAVATSLHIVDHPDGKRKLQRRPTALLGGIAVLLALGLGVAISADFLGTFTQRCCVVVSFCFLCAVGACDDIWNMRAKWKLLCQVIASLPLVIGMLHVESIHFSGMTLQLGALGYLFALLWLVAGVNAMNMIDGMDGLASTTGICTAFSISILAWFTGHVACAPLAMALAGSLLGFLYFNRPPASIYLGDAGSMVIGLVVAALALRSATTTDGEVAIIPLVAVLGLPLLDMTLAVSRRWLSGLGISQPDRLHVHHRLLEAGFRIPQILAMIAGLCLVLGALAISAAATRLDWVAIIGSLAIVAAMLRMRLIGHHEWRLAGNWLRMRFATWADQATPNTAEPLRIFGPSISREPAKELPAEERRAA